jgi:stage II sporulation protein D
MQWNRQLNSEGGSRAVGARPPLSARYRTYIAIAAILGVGACVSLSSPGAGGGNVPVVRGAYKNGRNQIVRIALATAAREGPDPGSGTGPTVVRPEPGNPFVLWNGKRYRGELVVSATDSGLLIVNRLPMDDYLRGVVPLEIGNRTAAEFAAVQAQAVAARTYAYKHLNDTRAFDMYSTVQDQVYGGVDAEKPQADSAIMTTADVVVLYAGQPISTPYSSTCGGSTAAVSEVWYTQPDEPYLRPVSDRIPSSDHYYCDPSPRFSWTQSFDGTGLRAVMEKYLAAYTNAPKTGVGRITDIRELGKTPSGRVAALEVQTDSGTYRLRGNDIRFVLRDPKGAILNSTYFNFTREQNGGEVSALNVNGRGYGHGIGMCQWGAIGRARAGQNYRTILETYYRGTTIGRIAG